MPSLEVDEESSIESAGVQTGGGRDAAPVDSSQQQADPSQLRGSPTKPKMGGLTPMEGYDMAYSGGIPLVDWSGLSNALEMPDSISTSVRSRVFEDNTAAVLLANNHRITSRTRYFHVKWHFFWEFVARKDITVEYVSTDNQRADYMTKQNPRFVFERIRKMNQGW